MHTGPLYPSASDGTTSSHLHPPSCNPPLEHLLHIPCSQQAHRTRPRPAPPQHESILKLIFERLPPGDQCFTISRISKQWALWSTPMQATLKAETQRSIFSHQRAASFQLPLWYLQEAWPTLSQHQRRWAAERAAFRGGLHTLNWTRSAGVPWDTPTCSCAASGGHLNVLKHIREGGCPWDGRTCLAAAARGQLEVLQYAVGAGCPWSRGACRMVALQRRQAHVVQWVDSLPGQPPGG